MYQRAMSEAQERPSSRLSWRVRLIHSTAVAMTLFALIENNIVVTSGRYRGIVITAIVCSAVATVLLGLIWRRLSSTRQWASVILVAANVLNLYDAVGRRLPAVMDW